MSLPNFNIYETAIIYTRYLCCPKHTLASHSLLSSSPLLSSLATEKNSRPLLDRSRSVLVEHRLPLQEQSSPIFRSSASKRLMLCFGDLNWEAYGP
ncbi:hypothetical protein ACSBR2_023859 [Camellia fascicularis]